MSVRFRLILSDDLAREVERAARESHSDKGGILCKALQLYLIALSASREGMKVALVDPETGRLNTEIVGL